jgi:glycosyltransferase involved in cell wall biosynthesis
MKEVFIIKDIDIIIPCYNSVKTLPCTLASIAMQSIKDQCTVYICDDCGTDNYDEVIDTFSNLIDIVYLRSIKNGGVGVNRQFGLDHSSSAYIVFIDSDDTFEGSLALELLYQGIKNNDCDIVSAKFNSDNRSSGGVIMCEYEKQLTWLHGKIYSRKFMTDNNITFLDLRLNEDGCFNQCFALKRARIKYIDDIVYTWRTNKDSLTRTDKPLTRFNVLLSYIDGIATSFNFATTNGEYDKSVLKTQISHGLVMMYFYYNEVALTLSEDISAKYMDKCKWFYKECYSKLENEISDMDLRMRYFEILNSSDNYKVYFPVITFYEFCEGLGN